MDFKYRVYHSNEHRSAWDRLHVIDEERALYEYSHFPTALHLHFSEKPFSASCIPATPATDGVLVTLRTELDEVAADQALADMATWLNNASPGLCLVIEKVKK